MTDILTVWHFYGEIYGKLFSAYAECPWPFWPFLLMLQWAISLFILFPIWFPIGIIGSIIAKCIKPETWGQT